MNPILIYDTETTGFPDWKAPSSAEHQPHIVQMAAHLVDEDTWDILQTMNVIVRPEGWVIPDEVIQTHGITNEMAKDVGVSESLAVEMLLEMRQDFRRVAHNEGFDARIIRIATCRYMDPATQDEWKGGEALCTARLATDIVCLPPSEAMLAKGNTRHKIPNLTEAHQHFYGKGFDGAHSALADVEACLAVYKAIVAHHATNGTEPA